MAKTTTFSTIKKAIDGFDKKALIALIGELYMLNTQNKDFLNTRFAEDKTEAIAKYRKIVGKSLYVAIENSSRDISFRDANKAISDYKKATGDVEGIAELLVYGAECATQFASDYGDSDATFCDSLSRLFLKAVEAVTQLEKHTAPLFIARLHVIVEKTSHCGYGLGDSTADDFDAAFPDYKKS